MKWLFIVFLLYLISLFFREQKIPGSFVESIVSDFLPTNTAVSVGYVSVGFSDGVRINDFKIYDSVSVDYCEPIASFKRASVRPLMREIEIESLTYKRLPANYYAEGNSEKNSRCEFRFPALGEFELLLVKPEILSVAPESVSATVNVSEQRIDVGNIYLKWPDTDAKMNLEGKCRVDLASQEIVGEVEGAAKQHNVRPLIETLDLPSALPYIDAFTSVQGPVPSKCSWRVNLVNNDLDLFLHFQPVLGKYNDVPMQRADGKLQLRVYTRGNSLNYRHTIGPIFAANSTDRLLSGTVEILGTNGYNAVDVDARSAMPVAELLKIGGFTGNYVGEECFGDSKCKLHFEFPRSMTNNYEVLNGSGHIEIANGQILRMEGFTGLLTLLADRIPTVSWITDSTQASCDYKIVDGVLSSENIFIEGTVFSIKMYGKFDIVKNELDFTVRVQFTKKDSIVGKILHPVTWPFTKLLLEFKLSGTPENPNWKYITVIDRVVDAVK